MPKNYRPPFLPPQRYRLLCAVLLISLLLSACRGAPATQPVTSAGVEQGAAGGAATSTGAPGTAPTSEGPAAATNAGSLEGIPAAQPLPVQPYTEVTFRVQLPPETPPTAGVYLTILDEVTGLALNTEQHVMQPANTSTTYELRLKLPVGTLVRYRYERMAEGIRLAEHTSDGSPVRYRLYHVEGPGEVVDVVSRWTDTPFTATPGRISGRITSGGQPAPNLFVTAGGQQTMTHSDGSYLLEGLPSGIHNLVTLAADGSYLTHQQGAQVDAQATTPANFEVSPAQQVSVIFVVRPPAGTPANVPLRLAGSLSQLGNTFANLAGGVNTLADRMPVLNALPDGRFTITISLPVGADVRYKYTLGDGLWNAELYNGGKFRLRQVVVPNHNVLIQDTIDTWTTPGKGSLTFDLTIPESTPAGDGIWLQLNPLFGWTEPIPMWQIGPQRWAYILYNPLDLPGSLSYRYCRNAQCGRAGDVATPGLYGAGRPVTITDTPQSLQDQVTAWADLTVSSELDTALLDQLVSFPPEARGNTFWAGVEFEAAYHASWAGRLNPALDEVQRLGSNWLVLTPTWSYATTPFSGAASGPQSSAVLEPMSGRDAPWSEMFATASAASQRGLQVAIFPTPQFPTPLDAWWQSAPRDFSWWLEWFYHYQAFLLHHADLAEQSGASVMIIGGDWLTPALPGGTLADGTPSSVPADAGERWRTMIASIRSRYSGNLYWAAGPDAMAAPPDFVSEMNGLYLLWDPATMPGRIENSPLISAEAAVIAGQYLDGPLAAVQSQTGLPVVMALSASTTPEIQQQVYQVMLGLTVQRPWITGFIARGFYPPAIVMDASASIHGKPSSRLLEQWFTALIGTE